eukprot:9466438-Pyramimonas_sp.AAC.1
MEEGQVSANTIEFSAFFLAEGDSNDRAIAARTPARTRPLSLPNTNNKLISSCIAVPLGEVAGDKVHPSQRGFLKGRLLVDSAIGMDANM